MVKYKRVTELECAHSEWKCYNAEGLLLDHSGSHLPITDLGAHLGGAKEYAVYVVAPGRLPEADCYRGVELKETWSATSGAFSWRCYLRE